jgi:hypothetical protein
MSPYMAVPPFPKSPSDFREQGLLRTVVWEGWAGDRSPYPDLSCPGYLLCCGGCCLEGRLKTGRRYLPKFAVVSRDHPRNRS